MNQTETAEAFRDRARAWLEQNAEPRPTTASDAVEVHVYLNVDLDTERENIARAVEWHQKKLEAGFAAIDWAVEDGGQGLPNSFVQAFRTEEKHFATPDLHETFIVTTGMIAPSLRDFASSALKEDLLEPMLTGSEMCAQLLSEPNAGSDLASLSTRAVRHDDEWEVNGQKVWSSGAMIAKWGFLLARSDPDAPKHRGLTAFMVPLDTPGIEVRPLKQMTGGSSFNEVFLTDVLIPDSLRVGDEGQGWRIIMAQLSYERSGTESWTAGGSYRQVRDLALGLGRESEPLVRQQLARLYIGDRLIQWNAQRASASGNEGPPGADANIGKLLYGLQMDLVTAAVSHLLGPALVVEANEHHVWAEHVTGTPAYHIAGGTNEVQRNILGERFLGLPGEPQPN
ncbi:MAG: acyl-CoA dehydrogenase family protein [Acidimicrobiales bacterium]